MMKIRRTPSEGHPHENNLRADHFPILYDHITSKHLDPHIFITFLYLPISSLIASAHL